MIKIKNVKLLGFIIAVCLVISLFVSTSSEEVKASTTETVTAYNATGSVISPANVVDIPNGTDYKILTTYSRGQNVTIVGKSKSFYKIKYNNTYAYVLTSRINTSATTETVTTYNANGTVISPANVVDIPNGSVYKVLKTYAKGQNVTIVGKSKSFYKIKYNNTYAYVLTSRIKASITETVTAYNAKGTVISPANVVDIPSGSGYKVLKTYSRGQNVTIVGKSKSFYKIKYNNTYAYVLTSRINTSATTETVTTYNANGTVISPANVVDIPNGSVYKVLKTYAKGQNVTIVGKSKSFYKIKYNNTYAYVLTSRIKASKTETVTAYNAKGTVLSPANVVDIPSGSGYKVLKTYAKGQNVTIVGKSKSFYKIKYNNTYAYVLTSRIKASPTETVTAYSATGTVLSPANIVDIPNGLVYKVLKTYSRGQKVSIVGKSKSFYKIKYNNTYAYVLINRIQVVKPYTGLAKIEANVKSYTLPNSSSKVLRTIKKSNTVDVIGTVGNWYEVKIGNSIEYIPNKNVKVSATEAVTAYTATGTIKSPANVVDIPNGTVYKILNKYSKGQTVTIVGKTKSFYKIKYNKTYAYVLISRVDLHSPITNLIIGPYVNPIEETDVYEQPSLYAKVKGTFETTEEAEVVKKSGDWVGLKAKNGEVYWVLKDKVYSIFSF